MKLQLMKQRNLWLSIAAILAVLSVASIMVKGFNLGIDFTGGTLIETRFHQSIEIADVRDVMSEHGLGNSMIQVAGQTDENNATNGTTIFIRTYDLEENERAELMADFSEKFGAFDVLRIERVGATVGAELTQNALIAFAISVVLILLYVSFRFEYRFAISGIIALVYNLLITVGIYCFLQGEVDSNFIAATLTILGYSINDTIVIFDRIRENMKASQRSDDIVEIADFSINQSVRRTIYTVLIILFTTVSLYLFGGDTTRDFALVMTIGFSFGCLTSIFIAPALWLTFKKSNETKEVRTAA